MANAGLNENMLLSKDQNILENYPMLYFFREPGYEVLVQKLSLAQEVGIAAPTLVECGIVLSARMGRDARGPLSRFLQEMNIVTIPFIDSHMSAAVGSWIRCGKYRSMNLL